MSQTCKKQVHLRYWEEGDDITFSGYGNNKAISDYMTDAFPHPLSPSFAKSWISYEINMRQVQQTRWNIVENETNQMSSFLMLSRYPPKQSVEFAISLSDPSVTIPSQKGVPNFKDGSHLVTLSNASVENSLAVGGVSIGLRSDVKRKSVEVGYWLAQQFWGKGIATEAVSQVSNYIFTDEFTKLWNNGDEVVRIEASVFDGNIASKRVLEKCGFQHEATLKSSIFKNDKLMDAVLFVKLKQNTKEE